MEENPKMINIEVERNGRKYYFVMPDNCPAGEAFDASYEILSKIVGIAKDIVESIKRKDEVKSDQEQ